MSVVPSDNENRKRGYNTYLSQGIDRKMKHLLVHLNLDLNYYEVSEWEVYYLKIWAESAELDYVPVNKLLVRLGLIGSDLCKFYFAIYVILSLANSHSNRVIHKSNVIRFLKILGCKEKDVESCQLWLDGMAPTDRHGYVNLSSFIYFINSCSNYLSPLQYVRAKVINEVIGDKTYFNILNRKVFYDSCIGEGKVENPPKEPCIVSFYRIIFTQEPDPYHCDYKPFLLCKTADECLNDIRKRYGYATRPTRDINVSLFSSRSLKLKHSNSTTSNSSLLCEKNHLSATLSDSRAKFKSSSISSKVIDLSANGIIISKAHSVIPKLKVKRSNKIVDSSTIL